MFKAVEKQIDAYVTAFIGSVCEKYPELNNEELHASWVVVKKTKLQTKKGDAAAASTAKTCKYIKKKGAAQGQKCNTKAIEGFEYCSIHKRTVDKQSVKNEVKNTPAIVMKAGEIP